jgi:transcriptional regulator with XRE-family HTH domain
MDAKKFGSFVAASRKEKGLTQMELAGKLQVTDKAVSRWERGIGFPDIGMLEPLAESLGITVLELLKSESLEQQEISAEDVSEAFVETIQIAKEQQKVWKLRLFILCTDIILVCIIPLIRILTGISLAKILPVIVLLIMASGVTYMALRKKFSFRDLDSAEK